jgi:hypothetical protein
MGKCQEGMGSPVWWKHRADGIPIPRGIKPSKSRCSELLGVSGWETAGEDRVWQQARISGRNKTLKVEAQECSGVECLREVAEVACGPSR